MFSTLIARIGWRAEVEDSILNFYNHHIGDYLKKTPHLSVTQHGAYFLLMQHFYATQAPLPTDKSSLYRIAKAETKPERNAVDSVIQQFGKRQMVASSTVALRGDR